MDDRIDVTNRKPRRLRGTPARSFINRASLIVLGIGTAIGLATTLPFNVVDHVREKYNFDIVNVSQEEKDKRTVFTKTLSKRRSGVEILEIIKENEKLKQE